jgi:hypothetical protein
MQSKKYQCYNINVQTLVVYATIETKFQTGKNLPKTLCKNLLKIPCGQKSVWVSQKLLTIH